MVVVAGWVVDSLLLWLVGAMVGLTVVVVESVGAFAFNRLLIHFGSVSGSLEPEEIQREQ